MKWYLTSTYIKNRHPLASNFSFFLFLRQYETVFETLKTDSLSSKYVSTHLEHTCGPSDCEAVLSFNFELLFMSCFLKIWSGFEGVSSLKRKLYFPLCYYILEEGAFLSFLVSPPLLLHLCCSVGSSILHCVSGGVGGGEAILKAEAINLQKKSKIKVAACVLFIIHTESAKIVLKMFNVEVKTTAPHVRVCEQYRWSQHRTPLDKGAGPPAWEPRSSRRYAPYPRLWHFSRFLPSVAVNHLSPLSSPRRSSATISGYFTFTCFSSWIWKSCWSLARSVSNTFVQVWPAEKNVPGVWRFALSTSILPLHSVPLGSSLVW